MAVADEVGANGVLEWYDHVEYVGIAFEDETPASGAPQWHDSNDILMFFYGIYNQPGGADTMIVLLDAMGNIVKVFTDEADLPYDDSALESEVKDQEFYSRPRRFVKSEIPAHLRAILSRVVVLLEFCDSLLSKAFMKDF